MARLEWPRLRRPPPSSTTASPAPAIRTIYPGLWARGSFGELNRDASVSFTSFGPATAHLNRDQRTGDFQAGVDFGARDVLGSGDALIFGVLGGFVVSELDYDQLAQSFDLNGGQVGAYATYLNGGLFIDTLFKADFVDLDPKSTVGFAGSLDAQNFGVRVDSGYRFGGFGPGMFFEPLATIGVVDSEIDNFTQGGNRVNFDDGTSVRGRLGLRVGTSFKTAQMTVEPFVIGSVWHEFEDEQQGDAGEFRHLVQSGRQLRRHLGRGERRHQPLQPRGRRFRLRQGRCRVWRRYRRRRRPGRRALQVVTG